jgi:hypothetical protein
MLALGLVGPGCSLIFEASGDGGMDTPPIDASLGNDRDIADDADTPVCGHPFDDVIVRFPVDSDQGRTRLTTSAGAPLGHVLRATDPADPVLVPVSVGTENGPGDCGDGLSILSAAAGTFVRIDNNDLSGVKSVDFWFNLASQVATDDGYGVLLSKDGNTSQDGDLLVVVFDSGPAIRVGLRIQSSIPDTFVACSEALTLGEWHHVAVSLSAAAAEGATLFVDGLPSGNMAGSIGAGLSADCTPVGDGNAAKYATLGTNLHDWFWGASNHRFLVGQDIPAVTNDYRVVPVLLDELRFRSEIFTQSDAESAYDAVMLP